jgi:O-acetyl-ADP-ribose deacetylase (regulator of RNase III)
MVRMSHLIAEHRLPSGQVLQLIHGDLTEERVDAIVNAANPSLRHGGGVAGAIVRRGGAVIQQESDRWVGAHGLVSHESPALTGAGRLPCRHVIHAVGPVWGEGNEDSKLLAAVTGALCLADRQGFVSLALPAISTGIFGFPKDRGARILIDAILGFFTDHPSGTLKQVRIALIDLPSVRVFAAEFASRWPQSVSPS